jgi:hypothetical protein
MSSIDIFLDPKTLQDFCSNFAAQQHVFKSNVFANMMSAMGNGLSIATASTSGKAGKDVFFVLSTLNQLGYKARLEGSNLVVSWA